MPESLIFDIDGTLWDSTEVVAVGYNRQLVAEGYDHLCVTADTLRGLFGRTMQDIADVLFAEIPAPERYSLMERCMKSEGKELKKDPCAHLAYPGVAETLRTLAARHRLFIVSNSQRGYPQLLIGKLGIEDVISGHLCYGDTGTCKGETILKLMEIHNITDAVYIGDTQGDMEATYMAGLPFVYCAYGFGKPEKWDYRVESFPELADLF